MDDTTKDAAQSKRERGISRREFARRAALASAAASIAPGAALADPYVARPAGPARLPGEDGATPAEAASRAATPGADSAAAQAAGLPKLSPESQVEVDARIQTILSQYGSRFSDEQKADIRRLCAVAQPPLDRLRAYALENGDNPALYLKPLVEREKNPLEKTRVGQTPAASKKP